MIKFQHSQFILRLEIKSRTKAFVVKPTWLMINAKHKVKQVTWQTKTKFLFFLLFIQGNKKSKLVDVKFYKWKVFIIYFSNTFDFQWRAIKSTTTTTTTFNSQYDAIGIDHRIETPWEKTDVLK